MAALGSLFDSAKTAGAGSVHRLQHAYAPDRHPASSWQTRRVYGGRRPVHRRGRANPTTTTCRTLPAFTPRDPTARWPKLLRDPFPADQTGRHTVLSSRSQLGRQQGPVRPRGHPVRVDRGDCAGQQPRRSCRTPPWPCAAAGSTPWSRSLTTSCVAGFPGHRPRGGAGTPAGLCLPERRGQARGRAWSLARDYVDAGREAALKAVRVMRGESPARIPFSPPTRTQKLVNLKQAQESGLSIPEALLREAKQVTRPLPTLTHAPLWKSPAQARAEQFEIKLKGRMDATWSDHVARALAECVQSGQHVIRGGHGGGGLHQLCRHTHPGALRPPAQRRSRGASAWSTPPATFGRCWNWRGSLRS